MKAIVEIAGAETRGILPQITLPIEENKTFNICSDATYRLINLNIKENEKDIKVKAELILMTYAFYHRRKASIRLTTKSGNYIIEYTYRTKIETRERTNRVRYFKERANSRTNIVTKTVSKEKLDEIIGDMCDMGDMGDIEKYVTPDKVTTLFELDVFKWHDDRNYRAVPALWQPLYGYI